MEKRCHKLPEKNHHTYSMLHLEKHSDKYFFAQSEKKRHKKQCIRCILYFPIEFQLTSGGYSF